MQILITGAAGSLGRLLAERLGTDPAVKTVIALDSRVYRSQPPGIRFVRASLRQPEWTPLLREMDAVVYLAGAEWPARQDADLPNVEDAKFAFQAARNAGVRKVISLCSGLVYGPQPAGAVRESAPVHGHQGGRYARAWAMISDYLDVLERETPDRIWTRFRTAWIAGPHHLALARYFANRPALGCGCEARPFQAVSEEDVTAALHLALHEDLSGVYHVAADDGIPLRDVAGLAEPLRACQPLPWLLLRAWMRGKQTFSWVRALYQSQPLDAKKLRAAGWSPHLTTREVLRSTFSAGV
jgi:nucleoside-diphosphate-sugar epimerase